MLLFILFFILPTASNATLRLDLPRGEAMISHELAGKRAELCFVPKHLPVGDYSKKDVERETTLCGYKINETVSACAKDNSSNPGVNFFTPPKGTSVEQLTQADCEMKDAKKQAKYKLSTSCSYTPAILAYYHFSRALGDIVNVPVAVVRTMDLERHLSIGERGLQITKPRSGEQPSLIYQTWKSLMSSLKEGSRGGRADLLFTDGYDQSYGALSRNPRGEEKYGEFFNGGSDRVAAFKAKNKIYRALTKVDFSVGREFNQANVQAMVQMRDAANFILLDTVLGQQDRFGNIHAEEKYFYLVEKDGKIELKSKDKLEEVPVELQAQAVIAKEMILKDNDCGVAKDNKIKAGRLLDKVAHMDPKTYKHLLALDSSIDEANFQTLLSQEILFTEKDYRTVRTNLKEAVNLLKAACQSGRLRLDLDLDAHFSGAPLPNQYQCE